MVTLAVLALVAAGSAVLGWCAVQVAADADGAGTLLALERAALERWGRGDPSGFLELAAPGVTCIDPAGGRRGHGTGAMAQRLRATLGGPGPERVELCDPCLAVHGETAVLTYDCASRSSAGERRFRCTEVYRHLPEGWRIVHSHWSPPVAA